MHGTTIKKTNTHTHTHTHTHNIIMYYNTLKNLIYLVIMAAEVKMPELFN